MHLSYIAARAFGKVKQAKHSLSDGLVVVRGENKAGKTTLFTQVPQYVMFGSSTLEATLDETVTEGEPVSALYGEIHYGPYIAKRSKNSASVEGPGVKRSGQDEVSRFFYDLFGLAPKTEDLIIFARQGEVSNVIKRKPAETMRFIEDVANIQLIEDLLEKVKSKYKYGNREEYEQLISTIEEDIDWYGLNLAQAKETKVSLESEAEILKDFSSEVDELEKIIAELLASISDKLSDYSAHNYKVQSTNEKVAELEGRVKTIYEKLANLKELVFEVIPQSNIDKANEIIHNAGEAGAKWSMYQLLINTVDVGEDVWDGGIDSLNNELKYAVSVERDLFKVVSNIESDIRSHKKQIPTTSKCNSCGTDLSEKVEALKLSIQEKIENLTTDLAIKKAEYSEAKSYLDTLNSVKKNHMARLHLDSTYYEIDNATVPFTVTWKGEVPTEPNQGEKKEAISLIKKAESIKRQKEENEKKITEAQVELGNEEGRLRNLRAELEELGNKKDETELLKRSACLRNASFEINNSSTQVALDMKEVEHRLEEANTKIKWAEEGIASNKVKIEELKVKIKTEARNQVIVKATTVAKPKVIDKLWTSIVTLAGERYRQMTGDSQQLVKTPKGFRLGVRPMTRLSGFERTVMGLAIRSTIRDIFAPGCGFLVFDELFAECSKNSAAIVAGALLNIPGQRILITHEDETEMSADQVIEV